MASSLPVLVVGDVHGDLERLFSALEPYPADEWQTIFLGDLVDGGAFGVGALRYARDRPNATLILGNHEVMMLWAARDPSQMSYWLSIGGQSHDLQELRGDPELEDWMRQQPLLARLPDGTLAQHCDTDFYRRLDDSTADDAVSAINLEGSRLLGSGGERELWDVLSPGRMFRVQGSRLDAWLDRTRSPRLIHGHVPHGKREPDSYQHGLAICYDGSLSRYYGSRFRRAGPLAATVAPLPEG